MALTDSQKHHLNRIKRLLNRKQQEIYLQNLPDLSYHLGSEPDESHANESFEMEINFDSEDSSSDSSHRESLILVNPSFKDYCEVTLSAILSHGNLSLKAADKFIYLMNNLIKRFANHTITLPNVRSFWVKQARESPLNVYIICENLHTHGPFFGDPQFYGYFNCGDKLVKAELIQGNYFFHIPLRHQLMKYLPLIDDSMWTEKAFQDFLEESQDSHLTLTLHSDEVSAFNSSSVKIFPVFATINQLIPSARRKYFFMIALFVGANKPRVSNFLNPVCEELKQLSMSHIQWESTNGIKRKARFFVSAVIADAPMRAYLRNVRQYNHIYGCDWCLVQATSANGARVYPNLDESDLANLKRSHKDFVRFGAEDSHRYMETDSRYSGIIGSSPLMILPKFNIVEGFVVEPMHCLILGVFRAILNRGWLQADSNSSVFARSVDRNFFKREMSQRIMKIRVPSYFVRGPRSLEMIKFWKSNELDSFLCYYLILSVRGLIQVRYINHISCLVKIIHLTHMETTSENLNDRVIAIRELVTEFQRGVAVLYGSHLLSYNLHIMSHLADSYCVLGPSSGFSSYPLEDQMGMLKKNVKRASNIAPSLVRVFLNKFRYNDLILSKLCRWNLTDQEIKAFGMANDSVFEERMSDENSIPFIKSKQKIHQIDGAAQRLIRNEVLENRISDSSIFLVDSLKLHSVRFSTVTYAKDKKRDDSKIRIAEKEFMKISYIFSVDEKIFFAIGKKYKTKIYNLTFDGFTRRFNNKFEFIHMILDSEENYSIVKIDTTMIPVLMIPSADFHYTYKNHFIVEPFLKNR